METIFRVQWFECCLATIAVETYVYNNKKNNNKNKKKKTITNNVANKQQEKLIKPRKLVYT